MTLYKKVGRRYHPVAEEVELESFPEGATLVIVKPGWQSRIFRIDPDHASLIAAARTARDAMVKRMAEINRFRPARTPITLREKRAWDRLKEEIGESLVYLSSPSLDEIAEAGIQALIEEAQKEGK